jgi:hypothetical protein
MHTELKWHYMITKEEICWFVLIVENHQSNVRVRNHI